LKTKALIAAVCGVAVAIPSLAYGRQQTATVTAVDAGTTHAWDGGTVTIAKGGTVTFRYPSGTSTHFVSFGDTQPTACSGVPTGPAGPGWEGTCRFDTPGTYAFVCPVHPDQMTGTITVVGPPAVTPTATPTPTPGGGGAPGATPTPVAGSGTTATQTTLPVSLAKAQTGARVRGTVRVELAGSRLEVSVWAPRRTISGGRSARPVRIGRFAKSSTPAGKVSFAIAIDAKARSALRRHRRLSVTVAVALTLPGGHKLTRSEKGTLRAS
jgi:plastocyanin